MLGLHWALLIAVAAGWLAPRAGQWRRERHARGLDQGGSAAAFALADAVSGGASLRASVAVAARRLHGPIAGELSRTAWELEMGAATEAALERLRSRSASRALALIVAAMQVQRHSGGDLPRVLRDVATALAQERRVLEEGRAATAQARFTAAVVIALPLCGIGLGALASPGLLARMTASPFGVGLLVAAFALQVSGALLIRRLASTLS
jgi:tight adherence protein B